MPAETLIFVRSHQALPPPLELIEGFHLLEADTDSKKSLRQLLKDHPADVVLVAAMPWTVRFWRTWFWQRRHQPQALFGAVLPPARRCWEGVFRRLVAAIADFLLIADDETAQAFRHLNYPSHRIFLPTIDGDPRLLSAATPARSNFIRARLAAERRSVLWVDPNITPSSPSMKNLIASAPSLREAGWEVRLWCSHSSLETVETTRLPVPDRPAILMIFGFFVVANSYRLWRRLLKGRAPARMVHSNGAYYLGADIVSIHFIDALWWRQQWKLRAAGWRDKVGRLFTLLGIGMESLQYRHQDCHLFLAVSDSVATEVRRRCRPHARVQVLASCYDESEFHLGVKDHWRELKRAELGFKPEEKILAFISQGSYQRKGFWLAVEALALLRGMKPPVPPARLMVIGGRAERIEELKCKLTQVYPDWSEWILFTGFVPILAQHLVAADAFLFPSYFESFAAVEVEAAALGLPLLLTPHFGSEMVLQDGINGRLLAWEAEAMATQLNAFLREGIPGFRPNVGKGISRAQFRRAIEQIYTAESAGLRTYPSSEMTPSK
jgi:glycosyltransferase involved in cell wall biosynthesis